MMNLVLAISSLCLVSASVASHEDPSFIFELNNGSIKNENPSYTEQVTETYLSEELTTTLPYLPNVNSCGCGYPGTCLYSRDYRNCERCQIGFVKDSEDDTKCKYARENEKAFLLLSSSRKIKRISLDTKNSIKWIKNGKIASSRGIDYNFRANQLFWFNYKDETIYTAPLRNYSDAGKKRIMHEHFSDVYGIAVDWIYNHIYWVNNAKGTLSVSNYNGTMKKTLFQYGFQGTLSIVVNPLSGWMYYADIYTHKIERASLDRSRREVIFGTEMSYPQGLALDLVENRLYWSQGKSFTSIWSSNLDGSDQKMIFKPTESQFTRGDFRKITLFDKFIYLMEWSSNVIFKVNKCNGQELEMVYNSTFSLWDFKTYHSTMQPEGENLCLKRINQCSHFCFPVPSLSDDSVLVPTTTCGCPDGLYLSYDQQSCVLRLTF